MLCTHRESACDKNWKEFTLFFKFEQMIYGTSVVDLLSIIRSDTIYIIRAQVFNPLNLVKSLTQFLFTYTIYVGRNI